MSRNFGSTFAPRFVMTGIASLALSFAVAGCSSSSSTSDDAGTAACDLAGITTVMTTHSCFSSGCHDSAGSSASLNLTPDSGLATRLLGVAPAGGGALPSLCSGMSKIYLVKGSVPATGLFLDKISSNPGCGMRMPYNLPPLSTKEIACLQSWANTVTAAP